jgi:hypothetical protein
MADVGSVDIEVELIAWLRDRAPDGTVVRDELDNDLLGELPTWQVQRVGGDDDGIRLDRALVDVDVYAATRDDALAQSKMIRGWLLRALRGSATTGAVFGRVSTVAAPTVRPYENVGLRRVGATYEVFFHPVS